MLVIAPGGELGPVRAVSAQGVRRPGRGDVPLFGEGKLTGQRVGGSAVTADARGMAGFVRRTLIPLPGLRHWPAMLRIAATSRPARSHGHLQFFNAKQHLPPRIPGGWPGHRRWTGRLLQGPQTAISLERPPGREPCHGRRS